jgi:Spy/CpxP family protein refolding chaperone
MRKGAILAFALGLGLVFSLSATGQPPGGFKGKGGKGGFGGPGGGFGMKMQPGEIMPAVIQEILKLTEEQKQQVSELQKDVDAKLDKILTDEQKTQLKQMKERGFGGPGGKGGFGGGPGGKGGFPGKKGPDKKDPDKE